MNNLLCIFLFLCVAHGCFADDINLTFLEANRFYEEKKFELAVQQYETLLKKKPNPAAYYNLANSYYRLGKIGKAIVNYERAWKLSPRDEDINLNLKFARKVLNISEPSGIIKSIYKPLTTFELFLIVFLINCLFFVLLYLRLSRNANISLTTISIVFSVLFASFAILSFKIRDDNLPYAIVVANICEIKSGPGSEYKTELTLNEGMKVLIVAQRGDWTAVKVARHLGWTKQEMVEKI